MSRIIYGVSGEGSGHASRAREILKHLIAQEHEVRVLSYDRGYRDLKNDFSVFKIEGLHIASRDNKISIKNTVANNLARLPEGSASLSAAKQLFNSFAPDLVITDFEPMSAYLARKYDLPLISIDNQHFIRYMKFPKPKSFRKDVLLTRAIVKSMVPKPWVALITTFYSGKLRNHRSFAFPPILRTEVLDLTPRRGDHFLVYATHGYDSLPDLLKCFPQYRFRLYGFDRHDVDENLHYRPPGSQSFLDDLATSRGVIATAGYTLMTESLHLGKPMLVFPMQGQFEQVLNGYLLERLGLGAQATEPNQQSLQHYFDNLQLYASELQDYPRAGNRQILDKLDELLANDLMVLSEFRR